MIRSMTGFATAAFEVEGAAFELEVRTVNHRHLDLRVRLPRGMIAFESALRDRLRARVGRGKVDVTVRTATGAASVDTVNVDLAVAERYLGSATQLAERHGLPGGLDAATLLALPGVARLVERSLQAQPLREALHASLARALDGVDAMRCAEGGALGRELETRLARVDELAGGVEARADVVQQSVRERLRKRAKELARETGLLDQARLTQEIVLAADRLDVTEEVVRLRSHVEQFRGLLVAGERVGRRLDFLLQEMLREVNTIGSKGSDAPIAHLVVELKSELERLREQVQNVE